MAFRYYIINHYIIYFGTILATFFKGPPGAGKSTSTQLLGRNHGYIFYEGDAFFSGANPFIDPHIEFEPWQQNKQKPLKVNPSKHFINNF